jgi:hypothetical protein
LSADVGQHHLITGRGQTIRYFSLIVERDQTRENVSIPGNEQRKRNTIAA